MKKFTTLILIGVLLSCSKDEILTAPLENISQEGIRLGGFFGSDSLSTIKDKIGFTRIRYISKIDTTFGGDYGAVGCQTKTKAKIQDLKWIHQPGSTPTIRETLNIWNSNNQEWSSTSITSVDLSNTVDNSKISYEATFANGSKQQKDVMYNVIHKDEVLDIYRFSFGDTKAKNKESELLRVPNSFYNNWTETGPSTVTYKIEGVRGVYISNPIIYLVYQSDKLSKIYEVINENAWESMLKNNRIGIPAGSVLPDEDNALEWKFNSLNFKIEKVKIEGIKDPTLAISISK